MSPLPLDAATRATLRERLTQEAANEGRRRLRSINCRERSAVYGDEHHEPCRNDGTTCLCPCHDQPEAGSSERGP